jgi:hypothetical protein
MAENCKHGVDTRFCWLCNPRSDHSGASSRARASRPQNAKRRERIAGEPTMVRQGERLTFFFNNCHGREHARLFGSGAFFDLWTTSESQAIQAEKVNRRLRTGDECIVATRATDGQMVFTSYSFVHATDKPNPDDHGMPTIVFFGTAGTSETLSKGDAAQHLIYSAFFVKNGNFKRRSVIQG